MFNKIDKHRLHALVPNPTKFFFYWLDLSGERLRLR